MHIFEFLQFLGFLLLLCLTHSRPAVALPHHRNETYPSPALRERDDQPAESDIYNPNRKSFPHYTALGDGYAAGLGLDFTPFGDDPNPKCRRKQESYPWKLVGLKDILGIQTFNYPACFEDGPEQVKDQIDHSGMSVSSLPRVWYDFGQPDLVTISAGLHERDDNDDEEFSMLNQLLKQCYRGDILTQPGCRHAMKEAEGTFLNNAERYEKLYESALTYDLAKDQKREVYVLGYPLWYDEKAGKINSLCPEGKDTADVPQVPWPKFDPDGPEGDRFHIGDTESVAWMMNQLVTYLNTKIRTAVDTVNEKNFPGHVYFVDVDPFFEGHRVCDTEEPWFNVRTGTDLLLPTREGYQAMANAAIGVILELDMGNILELVDTQVAVPGSDLVPTER